MKYLTLLLVLAGVFPVAITAEEQISEKEQQCRTDAAMTYQSETWPCQKKKGAAQKKCIEKAEAKLNAAVEKCKEAK